MRGVASESVHDARQLLIKDGYDGTRQTPWNPLQVFCGVFWPIVSFIWVYWCIGFAPRYAMPVGAVFIGPILVLVVCILLTVKAYGRLRDGQQGRFVLVLTPCLWAALFAGCWLGDQNYWKYMVSFYDYQDLASYVNIDPNVDKGQTYMDSGQMYFKESTTVAVSKAIAFRNVDIYCAAPIVRKSLESQGDSSSQTGPIGANPGKEALPAPPESGTMDFWAVGVNCCDPNGHNFVCGAARNPHARSGIRELRDDIRPFYAMAVQEWVAWLGIPARHPLFFHWVQDPLVEVEKFASTGKTNFGIQCFLFSAASFGITLLLHSLLFRADY